MADVACFCGCLYSFDGSGAACPRCGEYASVTTGPEFRSAGRLQEEQTGAEISAARHEAQGGWGRGGWGRGDFLAGIAAGVAAREPGPGTDDHL